MGVVLVTGANRGIGLEFCRQMSARGDLVLGACRQSSPELLALGVRVVEDFDVTDGASVAQLSAKLAGEVIDILVSNAGINIQTEIDDLDIAAVERQLAVNATGPLRVVAGLLPLIRPGGKIALVTSRMGSLADNASGAWYGYRMSKAALNAAGVSLARDLRPRGVAVAMLHPGRVKTGMLRGAAAGSADVEPVDAVRGLLARLDALTLETSGGFWHGVTGESLPW